MVGETRGEVNHAGLWRYRLLSRCVKLGGRLLRRREGGTGESGTGACYMCSLRIFRGRRDWDIAGCADIVPLR